MRSFIPLLAITALVLAGCSAPASAPDTIAVVASTNVYGSVAASIGGNLVSVTSIIDDPSQDPHNFEGSARVQLALSKANVVIENGGGYDDWAGTLLSGADNRSATVLNVADLSGYDQSGEFNEHLWYDFPTVQKLVSSLVSTLSTRDPDHAKTFEANAATFSAGLRSLEQMEETLRARVHGAGVAITEPVPLYLLTASGLTNVTPAAFSESVEESTDVSPAVLQQTIDLFSTGKARLLVYNEQTGGPATDAALAAARANKIPVVPVTETMPAGSEYLAWMGTNLDAIGAALP